ncbi:hypothetical protein K440DRAFT_642130 [Wilcoxina mikolae CBS 423.85]|nr:hypothetical protein K440DRAFT_642130 [Wilcoxina mikolae CBS 423.85]
MDLLGKWQLRCIQRHAASISIPKATHPLIRSKLYVALSEPEKHVVLVEGNAVLGRAIVVRVRNTRTEVAAWRYDRQGPLRCEVVGSVAFRLSGELDNYLIVMCNIGDPSDLAELRPNEKACVWHDEETWW